MNPIVFINAAVSSAASITDPVHAHSAASGWITGVSSSLSTPLLAQSVLSRFSSIEAPSALSVTTEASVTSPSSTGKTSLQAVREQNELLAARRAVLNPLVQTYQKVYRALEKGDQASAYAVITCRFESTSTRFEEAAFLLSYPFFRDMLIPLLINSKNEKAYVETFKLLDSHWQMSANQILLQLPVAISAETRELRFVHRLVLECSKQSKETIQKWEESIGWDLASETFYRKFTSECFRYLSLPLIGLRQPIFDREIESVIAMRLVQAKGLLSSIREIDYSGQSLRSLCSAQCSQSANAFFCLVLNLFKNSPAHRTELTKTGRSFSIMAQNLQPQIDLALSLPSLVGSASSAAAGAGAYLSMPVATGAGADVSMPVATGAGGVTAAISARLTAPASRSSSLVDWSVWDPSLLVSSPLEPVSHSLNPAVRSSLLRDQALDRLWTHHQQLFASLQKGERGGETFETIIANWRSIKLNSDPMLLAAHWFSYGNFKANLSLYIRTEENRALLDRFFDEVSRELVKTKSALLRRPASEFDGLEIWLSQLILCASGLSLPEIVNWRNSLCLTPSALAEHVSLAEQFTRKQCDGFKLVIRPVFKGDAVAQELHAHCCLAESYIKAMTTLNPLSLSPHARTRQRLEIQTRICRLLMGRLFEISVELSRKIKNLINRLETFDCYFSESADRDADLGEASESHELSAAALILSSISKSEGSAPSGITLKAMSTAASALPETASGIIETTGESPADLALMLLDLKKSASPRRPVSEESSAVGDALSGFKRKRSHPLAMTGSHTHT